MAFSTTRLHRPTSVAQLQDLVARTPRLHALGTRHSFNRVADTDGDLVSVEALPASIDIDALARTVTVAAGVRYGALAEALHAAGWALPNLGSLPHISVAGACATGTHGSGDTNRCLAAGVVGIDFVRGDGEVERIRRGDAGFAGAVLALGALGITTSLTITIEPTFTVRQDVWRDAPLPTVLARIDEVLGAGYSVSLFTRWQRRDLVEQIWVKSRAASPTADGRAWGAREATHALHPVLTQDAGPVTEQGGRPGPWHERLPHFRAGHTPSSGHEQQSEYLIPREHAAAALEVVSRLDLGAALIVAEVRSIAADDLWLSPCHDRASVGLHFTWVPDHDVVRPVVTALETALAPFDPRPHWAKVFAQPADRVRGHYPRLARFRALAERVDPDRSFANAFLETYVY